jgi:hypothetical protein
VIIFLNLSKFICCGCGEPYNALLVVFFFFDKNALLVFYCRGCFWIEILKDYFDKKNFEGFKRFYEIMTFLLQS